MQPRRGKGVSSALAPSMRAARVASLLAGESRIRRGAVITRHEGGEDPSESISIGGSFAPHVLPSAIARWPERLRSLPGSMGFGGLNYMRPIGKVDRQFSVWLMNNLDTDMMLFRLANGVVEFIVEDDVVKILGIKSGSRKISLKKPDNLPELLTKVNLILGNVDKPHLKIQVTDLRRILEEPVPEVLTDKYMERIKVAYTLLAFSTFLAPRGVNAKVSDELLPCVAEPGEISEYNWASYIIDVIKEGASHLQMALKAKTGGVLLCGCLLFLQIRYLESLNTGDRSVPGAYEEPLIAQYGASRLVRLISLDTVETADGKEYGILQLNAESNQMSRDEDPTTPTDEVPSQRTIDGTLDEVAARVVGELVEESTKWDLHDLVEMHTLQHGKKAMRKRKIEELLKEKEKRHQKQLADCLNKYISTIKGTNKHQHERSKVGNNLYSDPAHVSAMLGITRDNMFYPGTSFLNTTGTAAAGMHPNFEAIAIANERMRSGRGIIISEGNRSDSNVPQVERANDKGKGLDLSEKVKNSSKRVLFKDQLMEGPLGEIIYGNYVGGGSSSGSKGMHQQLCDNDAATQENTTDISRQELLFEDEQRTSTPPGAIMTEATIVSHIAEVANIDNIAEREAQVDNNDGCPGIVNYTLDSIDDYEIVEAQEYFGAAGGSADGEENEGVLDTNTSNNKQRIGTPEEQRHTTATARDPDSGSQGSSGQRKLMIRLGGSSRRIPATRVGTEENNIIGRDNSTGGVEGLVSTTTRVPLYGRSPFDLGLRHTVASTSVINDFYDNVMYCQGSELAKNWYKSLEPTLLMITGKKLKYQFGLLRELEYNTMNASVRSMNKKELRMMEGSGEIHWRFIGSPDISLHFLVDPFNIDMEAIGDLMSAEMLGYSVNRCRMIELPVMVRNAWSVYAFDMLSKRLTVLDPMYTECSEEKYKQKHECTAKYMLMGLQTCGQELEEGWEMNWEEWRVVYNKGMHESSVMEDSGVYALHYLKEFDGVDLQKKLPAVQVLRARKLFLHEIVSMEGNIGDKPGFMLVELD